MILLATSFAALFVGPLLMAALARTAVAWVALDAFVVVAITGLVMLHIVPESVACAGWPALVALVVGLGLPAVLHGAHDSCHSKRSRALFTWLALAALGLHALLDGVALVPSHGAWDMDVSVLRTPLALGVVLHRLLEGAGIWWLTGEATSKATRLCALGAVGTLTWLGYGGGAWAIDHGALAAIAAIQTMVAGSLLHVLMRHGPRQTASPRAHGGSCALRPPVQERLASALGGSAALGLLAVLHLADGAHSHSGGQHGHGLDRLEAVAYLQALGSSIAPSVLWALAAAAVMHMVVPKWHSAALGVGTGWAVARGTVQGLLLAPCSCGVVPLYRRLLARKAPDVQALAYLLAAPGLGLVTLAVSWAVLGPLFTAVRVGGAIVLSAGVAWLAGAPAGPHAQDGHPGGPAADGHAHGHSNGHSHSPAPASSRLLAAGARGLWARGMDGLAFALGEVADFTAPWLVFGLLVAALCAEGLEPAWLQALEQAHLTVPAMALLALPLYLCGAASSLIVGVLMYKGLGVGGALTFVWSASMLSPAVFSSMQQRYGRRRALGVVGCLSLGVLLAGALAQKCMPHAQDLLHGGHAGALPAATWALWVLLLWAIARQGVREAVDQIALLNRDGALSHHHGR